MSRKLGIGKKGSSFFLLLFSFFFFPPVSFLSGNWWFDYTRRRRRRRRRIGGGSLTRNWKVPTKNRVNNSPTYSTARTICFPQNKNTIRAIQKTNCRLFGRSGWRFFSLQPCVGYSSSQFPLFCSPFPPQTTKIRINFERQRSKKTQKLRCRRQSKNQQRTGFIETLSAPETSPFPPLFSS